MSEALQSSGEVKIVKDLNTRVEGKEILIVERYHRYQANP